MLSIEHRRPAQDRQDLPGHESGDHRNRAPQAKAVSQSVGGAGIPLSRVSAATSSPIAPCERSLFRRGSRRFRTGNHPPGREQAVRGSQGEEGRATPPQIGIALTPGRRRHEPCASSRARASPSTGRGCPPGSIASSSSSARSKSSCSAGASSSSRSATPSPPAPSTCISSRSSTPRRCGFVWLRGSPAHARCCGGFVSPAIFIPVAEEIGLIIEDWRLGSCERSLRRWRPLSSRSPSRSRSICRRRSSKARRRPQDGHRRACSPRASRRSGSKSRSPRGPSSPTSRPLHARASPELKESASRIVMDDFGTGYSSLSYLWSSRSTSSRSTAPSCAALDAEEARSRLHAIMTLRRALGMRVWVEGVETQPAGGNSCGPRLRRGAGILFRDARCRSIWLRWQSCATCAART